MSILEPRRKRRRSSVSPVAWMLWTVAVTLAVMVGVDLVGLWRPCSSPA